MITVKAELANKLLDVDTERAVPSWPTSSGSPATPWPTYAVPWTGYRELSLPGELARARTALEAARIDAELPNSRRRRPLERRELFAWAIREGVTNVIRHSGATHCRSSCTRTGSRSSTTAGAPSTAQRPRVDRAAGARERRAGHGRHARAEPGFSLSVVLP